MDNPQNSPDAPQQTPEIPAPAPNSLRERIGKAAAGLFEKHGVTWRRGRGRPRADGLPKANDIPVSPPPECPATPTGVVPSASPAPDAGGLDSGIVRRCVASVARALTGALNAALRRKAARVTKDKAFADSLVAGATVTGEEVDSFSELAEVCLRKYGVGTEYCPEVGCVAIVAGVAVRYVTAFQKLDSWEADAKSNGTP